MFFSNDDNRGYSRGGLDVVTAVNLFFKFMLLSPVFLAALYVTLAMMKHMIFQGIPSMNKPTEEQIQRIRRSDENIGAPVVVQEAPKPVEVVTEEPVITPDPAYQRPPQPRTEVMEKFCIETWLPKYGYIEEARGGPCDVYR